MDDIVKQAMAKWPNVPACYGGLALDARGDWYMRDDRVQAAGAFPAVKGSRLVHDKLVDFIARNYASDDCGHWYFQNGPQRVYVELEATPVILRVEPAPGFAVSAHTGQLAQIAQLPQAAPAAQPATCLVGDDGRVYLLTDLGFGLVHTLDMTHAADAIEAGVWQPQPGAAAAFPARFGFVRRPQSLQKT
ncbi:MAG: DUF2946 family protein [Polaromonas sp.]|nr:DUF2946 family protein [Polaromonas sp.]